MSRLLPVLLLLAACPARPTASEGLSTPPPVASTPAPPPEPTPEPTPDPRSTPTPTATPSTPKPPACQRYTASFYGPPGAKLTVDGATAGTLLGPSQALSLSLCHGARRVAVDDGPDRKIELASKGARHFVWDATLRDFIKEQR